MMSKLVDNATAISFLDSNYKRDKYIISSNTIVEKKQVYLFGNKIAWKACKQIISSYDRKTKLEPLYIDMCGYGSKTTRLRLNAILDFYIKDTQYQWSHSNLIDKIYIKQSKDKQYLVINFKGKEDVSEMKNINTEINISEYLLDFIDHRFVKGTAMLKEDHIENYNQSVMKEVIPESQWIRVRDYQ